MEYKASNDMSATAPSINFRLEEPMILKIEKTADGKITLSLPQSGKSSSFTVNSEELEQVLAVLKLASASKVFSMEYTLP